jgi:hypothetical protein
LTGAAGLVCHAYHAYSKNEKPLMKDLLQSEDETMPPGSYSTSEVEKLRLLTERKDRRLARRMKNLSLLNVAAILAILLLMQFLLAHEAMGTFRIHARPALTAFLIGAIVVSFVYGMRTSTVVLRLTGSKTRFKVTGPVTFAILVGMTSFLTGSAFVYEGLSTIF